MPKVEDLQQHINSWSGDFKAVRTVTVFRPQQTYPKTLCVIWYQPAIGPQAPKWACQDVHYNDTTGAFQALGGFWVKDYTGAFKPEQDWKKHPSALRKKLYQNLVAFVPAQMPDTTDMPTWASEMNVAHTSSEATTSEVN